MMKIKSMRIKMKFPKILCQRMSLRSKSELAKGVKKVGWQEMLMNPNRNLAYLIITLSLTNFLKIGESYEN